MSNKLNEVLRVSAVPRIIILIIATFVITVTASAQNGQIRMLRDLEYSRPNGIPQLLDLYLPENARGPLPVIVWIHGGGWRSGNKNLSLNSIQVRQASRGYAVASINYRLSGVSKHPAQIEDCKAAIRWLRANAAQYNLNPEKIGVWGASAGGHLVSMLGTTADVSALEGSGGNLDQSSRVQAVVDWFGAIDFLKINSQALPCSVLDHDAPNSPESELLGCQVQNCPEIAKTANPITYITADDAPFLIMHGTNDCTVPPAQSQMLFDALKAAGIEASLVLLQGAGHGGPQFISPDSEQLVSSFFDRQLRAMAPAGDFNLSLTPMTQMVSAGASASINIGIQGIGGFNQPVNLSASLAPANSGIDLSLSRNSILPSSNATLTVTTASETLSGTFNIVVRGEAGQIVRTQSVTVDVLGKNSPPAIAAITDKVVKAGERLTVPVSTSDQNGSDGLKLSLITAPAFVSLTDNGNGNGTLIIAPSSDALEGGRVIIAVTDPGGLSAQAAFNVTVLANPQITGAQFVKPVLSISGSGFGSAGARVTINGKDITSLITSQANAQITLSGNRKRLGLVKGANQIIVITGGVASNSFTLTL